MVRQLDPVVRVLCVMTNASFALLFGVALFQMAQPQVFVGLALFAVAAVCDVSRVAAPERFPLTLEVAPSFDCLERAGFRDLGKGTAVGFVCPVN